MVTANVRLTRPLGEGAMGCVWVADHLTLRTEVAVKFISGQVASDPQIMARFLQEASVAAQIKSPHVVQTFDQGVMGDGTPYIVMELLEGESLQERLNREGRLSLALVARILVQLSRALGRAHDIGVVHRDIKPDNVFLVPGDDGPFCKILDFGIAKQTTLPAMGGLTSPGTMVGTPEYMSPEQVLSAKDVDFRADLWGLAVTAYHCITGTLPFEAEALGQLCVKLLDGSFIPPSQHVPGLPPAIDQWMARAIALQPEQRFSSAKELATTFTQIVAASGPADAELLLSATGTGANLTALTDSGAIAQPAPVAGVATASGSMPGQPVAGAVTGPGTLNGSSATSRAEPRRMPWTMLVLGGLAAVGAAVGAVVLVAAPDESAPASAAEREAQPSATVGEPSSADPPGAEPTSEAGEQPSAAPTAPASASAAASASATAEPSAKPVATAPPPPRPPRPPPTSKGSIKPIFR